MIEVRLVVKFKKCVIARLSSPGTGMEPPHHPVEPRDPLEALWGEADLLLKAVAERARDARTGAHRLEALGMGPPVVLTGPPIR